MYRIFGRILYGTVIPYLRSIRSRMHGVAELPHGGCARICSRQVLFPYSRTPFKQGIKPDMEVKFTIGKFYQFNLSSCIRQQNSLTAQFVSFSLSNLANIFYPPPIFTIINLCLL